MNASGQLVTIRANDQAFRKLKEVRGVGGLWGHVFCPCFFSCLFFLFSRRVFVRFAYDGLYCTCYFRNASGPRVSIRKNDY